MKRSAVRTALIAIAIAITISQTSTSQAQEKPSVTVAQRPTATRNALVRVNVLKIQKPKIFVGNPHRPSIFADDWDYDLVEVDDVITSYRRKDLVKLEYLDELPEHVRWRLFLARQLALLKHKEVHG